MIKSDHPKLSLIFDVLIPGDGKDWPPFSSASKDHGAIAALFDAAERSALESLADALGGAMPAARAALFSAFTEAQPQLARHLVAAVTEAYYVTPAVHAVVAALAERGPREPSDTFDEAQLAAVRTGNRGARRL